MPINNFFYYFSSLSMRGHFFTIAIINSRDEKIVQFTFAAVSYIRKFSAPRSELIDKLSAYFPCSLLDCMTELMTMTEGANLN